MNRILGIDLGEVRTGLAVSDPFGMMASGIGTVTAYSDEKLLQLICEKINEYKPERVVMGNPVNMNGSEGERSRRIRSFAEALEERAGLPVTLVDERMSTMEAYRYMNITDTRGKKRRSSVDTLSAEIILQSYLDREKNRKQGGV